MELSGGNNIKGKDKTTEREVLQYKLLQNSINFPINNHESIGFVIKRAQWHPLASKHAQIKLILIVQAIRRQAASFGRS